MLRMFLSLHERADQLARSKDVLLGDINAKKEQNREKVELIQKEINTLHDLHARVLTT